MSVPVNASYQKEAAEAFNKQSGIFDALYHSNKIVQYKRKRVRDHVEQYLKPNSSILELNAGTGDDAIYFAAKGHTVHATDIAVDMQEVLEKVHLSTKGFKMPHELSGGEQQRLVIARALLNDPDLILADEPTGNLDPETSDEIMQLLIQIAKDYGTTVLMATHDFIVINRYPSRMLKTEGGRVIDSAAVGV